MDGGLTPSVLFKIINIDAQIGETSRWSRAINRKAQRSTIITIAQAEERTIFAATHSPTGLRATSLRAERGHRINTGTGGDTHTLHF
jgi:hypothetical protein